jgi:methionyl-tRNA formyltransferase
MRKILFLGTPEVAAAALAYLLEHGGALFEVVGVVTQPPARSARRSGEIPSPVHALALQKNLRVFTPEKARDLDFLESVRMLAPDLCITAAYGNVLPDEFLSIPPFGTLNIHPSLLPKWRGAAPVQRSVEAGERESGVSVLFTVKAMDAGPLVCQEKVLVDENEAAPELLTRLFALGVEALVNVLPRVFSRDISPWEQDVSLVTHARKLDISESILDFSLSAVVLHNKVRAFSGWPGTRASFRLGEELLELKILRTRVGRGATRAGVVLVGGGVIRVGCGSETELEVLEIQAPGKKAMSAKDFANGLKGRELTLAT